MIHIRHLRLLTLCAVLPAVIAIGSAAEERGQPAFSEDDIAFFEKRIRPVLVQHCYECHSAEAAAQNKLRGGLRLDTREGVLAGGDSGPAATPGELQDGLLLQALRYESFEMPPSGQLPDNVVADFAEWIERGLPDPRTGATGKPQQIDIQAGRQHWAYRPLVPPSVPIVAVTSAETPIDAFVLRQLADKQLCQETVADPPTLIRRLYFDLLGLPPTPAEVDAFVSDASPVAYRDLVDRLLASPRFGERWGRHWLDVVRYADSITLRGFVFPEAWRYRDYVIDVFNQDQRLDQFIKEQVAGDLMPAATLDQRCRQLVATTFLALGNNNLEDQDKQKLRMDVVDEQLETIGRAFLAQTIGCARCHDHKFDPIPTRDYYALAGILQNTKTLEHANVSKWVEVPLPLPPDQEEVLRQHASAVAELESKVKALRQQNASGATPDESDQTADFAGLEAELKKLKQSAPQRPMTMSVQEEAEIGDTHVRIRGDVHNLGPLAPRGFLQVASYAPNPTFTNSQSGRLELGEWLTRPDNPLTARVLANRIWLWLFGKGLVRTPDNFGAMGESPTHPALLDYLANRLIQREWSAKSLIREIVLSRTYQLSSGTAPTSNSAAQMIDPENRLLWRMNRRRLEAECLLDTMLAVSGQLELMAGGPSIREGVKADYDYEHEGMRRRAVYWPVLRNSLPALFEVFDFANPSMVVGSRNTSSTAPQALYLMNNPFVIQQSQSAANRLLSDDSLSDAERIAHAFRVILGRPPDPAESAAVMACVQDARGASPNRMPDELRREIWAYVVQSLFGSIDFRYLR